jgi:anti-anti-sigma regulatory factor
MGLSFVENIATHHHDPAVATVVVDLPNTSFIDALGVGALIRARNRAEAAYSIGANGRIVRVFEIAGIADFLAGPKTTKLVGLLRGHNASTLSLLSEAKTPRRRGWGPRGIANTRL